jgi:hypothetical protein
MTQSRFEIGGINLSFFAFINIFVYISTREGQRVQALAGKTGSNIRTGERIASESISQGEAVGSSDA